MVPGVAGDHVGGGGREPADELFLHGDPSGYQRSRLRLPPVRTVTGSSPTVAAWVRASVALRARASSSWTAVRRCRELKASARPAAWRSGGVLAGGGAVRSVVEAEVAGEPAQPERLELEPASSQPASQDAGSPVELADAALVVLGVESTRTMPATASGCRAAYRRTTRPPREWPTSRYGAGIPAACSSWWSSSAIRLALRGHGPGSLQPRPARSYSTTATSGTSARWTRTHSNPREPSAGTTTTLGTPSPASHRCTRRPPASTSRPGGRNRRRSRQEPYAW
jgi:hypothetical protein